MGSLKERVQKNWRKVIAFSIIIFAIILAQDIIREIVLFNNEVRDLESSLNTQMKDELESEVMFRLNELDEMYDSLNQTFIDDLTHEIVTVHIASDALYSLMETATDQEIENQLVSLINDERVQNNLYDYAVVHIDGTIVFDQSGSFEIGDSVLGVQDSAGRTYIEDLITIITEDDLLHGSYTSYFNEADAQDQLSYHGFQLEGTDYIVYIQGSISEYLDMRLLEYSNLLQSYYSQKERSIAVFSLDGQMYVHTNEALVGTNVLESNDPVLAEAAQVIIDFTEEQDNGFIEVEFYDDFIDGDTNIKTSYINVHEDLNLVVAYSNDRSSYDNLLVQFQNENIKSVLTTLIPLYIAIVFIIVYVTRLILLNNKLSVDVLNEEEQLYQVFSDITEDIILITDKKGDIIFTNKLGHRTIFPTDEFTTLNLDDILVDEEAFKVLIGIEKNHYIKYTLSQVVYDGVECDLYILKDVTEKVTNERKLEAMTLADDLTGLGNRRLLLRDYKDYVLPYIKDGNLAYLAMIDLDNFKEANDRYGHTFGDEVLISISVIFKSFASNDVRIYRVGGDEFALLALNMSMNDCMKLIRKIKNKVSTFNYGKKVRIGFSAGLTEVNISDSKRRLSDYYERADELLYKAKDEGKDRIKV